MRSRFPLFSVRHLETYQVAVSHPLLPPSTVVGAVGKALYFAGECSGQSCMDAARRLVKKARDAAVEASKFGVVLRRARGVLEEERPPEDFEELRGYFDALYRDYVYSREKTLLIVPRDSGALNVLAKALWLLERAGDTESLLSVVDVEAVEAERCGGGFVNVVVSAEAARGGSYVVQKALDESGSVRLFSFPVASAAGGVYKPGVVKVDGGVLCAGEVKFPEGHGW